MRAGAPSDFGAEVVQAAARCSNEGGAARHPLLLRRRAAARDGAHALRPGRDDPLPAGDERRAPRGSRCAARTGSCGRSSACGARRRRRTAASAASTGARLVEPGDTLRGLIRHRRSLPLLERLHPTRSANVLRALDERRTMPPALAELLDAPVGSKRVDLGGGVQAVREHDRLWLERGARRAARQPRVGAWRIACELPGLKVRGWRPGDRLAGRTRKVQDVFVDARCPRSDREGWPLVVRGDEVRRRAGDRRGRRGERTPCRRLSWNAASARC